jgi:DNA-nicking Smr family endonuclease
MARRKRQKESAAGVERPPKEKPFFRPFEGLAKQLKADDRAAVGPPAAIATPIAAPPQDDASAFAAAMSGVRPLGSAPRRVGPPPPPAEPPARTMDDDTAALLELSEFVAGNGPFDIVDGDEHIEGATVGLDPRIMRRLRQGDYSCASHLDLHGLTRDEARVKLEQFVGDARRRGQRCVLVVHGRGLHSKDQKPVLKEALVAWFGRASLRKQILAFCSARPYDGGTGALYVLLRK